MPEEIKKNELTCGKTYFMLAPEGVKEVRLIAVNKFDRFTVAEKVETTFEYFIEGKVQVQPEQLFQTKAALVATL